jgi:hypothetical protein
MGAFGPVRGPVAKAQDPMPAPPYKVRANPWTLLPQTDLVRGSSKVLGHSGGCSGHGRCDPHVPHPA